MKKHSLMVLAMLTLATLACYRPGVGDASTPMPLTEAAPGEQATQEVEAPPETEEEHTEAPSAEAGGLRIVYPRNTGGIMGEDDQLWLWDADRNDASVLTTTGGISRFALSDDGQRVAWIHRIDFLHYDLWAVNGDGSDERQLIDAEAFIPLLDDPYASAVAPFQIEWIPGTHRLLYNTHYTFEGPGLALRDDLWMIDADTGEITELAGKGAGGRFYLSPDASQIALVRPNGISVMDIDGSSRRDNLLLIEPIGAGEGQVYLEPVWTPDGSRLLVSQPPADLFAEFPQASTIWEIMADGSRVEILTTLQAFPLLGPYFSPDGTRVIYQWPVGARIDNTWEMHIANVDGSQDRVYDTQPFLLFLGFSPDGRHFVYEAEQRTTIIGGPGLEPVSAPDLAIFTFGTELLHWVDDTHFVYLQRTDTGGSYQIMIGSIEDGSARQIGETGEVLFPAVAIAP